jgi:hypothetical protein
MEKVRMTVELPEKAHERLSELADELGISKIEFVRRSLMLADESHKAIREGKKIAVVSYDPQGVAHVEKQFIGL